MPDSSPLPEDVLADALGIVVAEIRAGWLRDLDHIKAEALAVVSTNSAAVAEVRAEVANLRLQARDITGQPGDNGERGDKGEPGEAGKDGRGILALDIASDGQLVVTFSDGEIKRLGRIVGADGVGIASIERRDGRLFFELDDDRVFDAGDIAGDPGEPGPQGPPGKDGAPASTDLIKAVVELDVHKAVQAIPIPKDGKDGLDGKDGRDGKDGIDGKAGIDGIDGKHGNDGRDGIDGKDGKDGVDGLSFEEFEETFDGERTITRTYRRGDKVIAAKTYKLPGSIYRRVWKDDRDYDRGDMVTWRGSLWHCNEPTNTRPEDGNTAWTLATKRGADGKNGKDGDTGPRGPEGRAGRDLTQVLPDGKKY